MLSIKLSGNEKFLPGWYEMTNAEMVAELGIIEPDDKFITDITITQSFLDATKFKMFNGKIYKWVDKLQNIQQDFEWFCPHCNRVLDERDVTFEETHDPRGNGCGKPVYARVEK